MFLLRTNDVTMFLLRTNDVFAEDKRLFPARQLLPPPPAHDVYEDFAEDKR